MSRKLKIILILGIILNFLIISYLRFVVEKNNKDRLNDYLIEANDKLVKMTEYALDYTRYVVASNYLNHLQITNLLTSSQMKTLQQDDPFDSGYKTKEAIDFHYFEYNGIPCAQYGISRVKIGSQFPLGGIVTAIYPDGIIIDNLYRYPNNAYRRYDSNNGYLQSLSNVRVNNQLINNLNNQLREQ